MEALPILYKKNLPFHVSIFFMDKDCTTIFSQEPKRVMHEKKLIKGKVTYKVLEGNLTPEDKFFLAKYKHAESREEKRRIVDNYYKKIISESIGMQNL